MYLYRLKSQLHISDLYSAYERTVVHGSVDSVNERMVDVMLENDLNVPIEIDDSDDEGDREVAGMQVANDTNGDEIKLNESRESSSATQSFNDQHIDIDLNIESVNEMNVKRVVKIENSGDTIDLPLVDFDPNKENETRSADSDGPEPAIMSNSNQSAALQIQLTRSNGNRFKCNDSEYSNKRQLIQKDSTEKAFKCKQCNYAFRRRVDLNRHQLIHWRYCYQTIQV